MFVKCFQWGISESVVVALAYNHNSVISSSCYYMNGDLFEILSGSPSAGVADVAAKKKTV